MKISELFEDTTDYRIQHQAPDKDSGSPLHDLRGVYPDDIYGPQAAIYYGHYGGNHPLDRESIRKIQSLRNKPKMGVQIYRAVPKGVKSINPNDWVTINKNYAIEHGESWLHGKYKILTKIVSAKDLYNSGDSIHEFGYDPVG